MFQSQHRFIKHRHLIAKLWFVCLSSATFVFFVLFHFYPQLKSSIFNIPVPSWKLFTITQNNMNIDANHFILWKKHTYSIRSKTHSSIWNVVRWCRATPANVLLLKFSHLLFLLALQEKQNTKLDSIALRVVKRRSFGVVRLECAAIWGWMIFNLIDLYKKISVFC